MIGPSLARSIPVWVYALLALLLLLGVQQLRVQHYRAQAITLQSAVLTFESAQKTNLDTIATLQRANADWARKCAADQTRALDEARNSAQADAQRQDKAAESIQTLRAEAKNDVSVKAWYDQPVPAAAVRMLTANGGTH